MTTATPSPTPGQIVSGAIKRLPKAAVIIVLLIVLPALIGGALGGSTGGAAMVIGMLGGLACSMARGYVTARKFLPVLALAFVLGGLTAGTWWWVLIAAALAALAGWSSALGLMPIFTMAALVMVTAKPITGFTSVVVGFAFVLIGGLFASEVARRSGAPAEIPGKPEKTRTAAAAAIALGLGIAAACAIALATDPERGYWIPMTILILAQPAPGGRGQKTRDRLIGTVIGFVLVIPLAALDVPRPVISVLAVLSLLLVVAVTAPYWLRVVFITLTIVLVLGPPNASLDFAERRLVETTIGVVILAAIGIFLLWWARRGKDALELAEVPEAL